MTLRPQYAGACLRPRSARQEGGEGGAALVGRRHTHRSVMCHNDFSSNVKTQSQTGGLIIIGLFTRPALEKAVKQLRYGVHGNGRAFVMHRDFNQMSVSFARQGDGGSRGPVLNGVPQEV